MVIGFNAFGEVNNLAFNNRLCHPTYNKLEITGGMIDEIYIDEDIEIPYTIEKPNEWGYKTVINAKFAGNLEGGNIEANNFRVEKIRFQRRRWDELEWHDVAEIEYLSDRKRIYEALDKYIANDFIYQYSIIPVAASVFGNRIVSNEVRAEFEGVFISDKESNYKLLYNLEISDMQHNIATNVYEPQGSRYPIVVYGALDYVSFDVTATFITAEALNGNISIQMERVNRDKLLAFMKNGKPKVYRDHHGNLKVVSVVGTPKETPNNQRGGIATLTFSLVEIGNADSETLKSYNLLEGFER